MLFIVLKLQSFQRYLNVDYKCFSVTGFQSLENLALTSNTVQPSSLSLFFSTQSTYPSSPMVMVLVGFCSVKAGRYER